MEDKRSGDTTQCIFCDIRMESGKSIDAGWITYFYPDENSTDELNNCCTRCADLFLTADDIGDFYVRPELQLLVTAYLGLDGTNHMIKLRPALFRYAELLRKLRLKILDEEEPIKLELVTIYCQRILSAGPSIIPEGVIEVNLHDVALDELMVTLMEENPEMFLSRVTSWLEKAPGFMEDFMNSLSQEIKDEIYSKIQEELCS